jgi:hypothetical protein
MPRAWWPLSIAPFDHRLTRTGERAGELELEGGEFFRAEEQPLVVGQQVALDGMTVTVLDANGPRPTRVGFVADVPLEDPSLLFLVWKDGGLRRTPLPPVGQSLVLRAETGLWGR